MLHQYRTVLYPRKRVAEIELPVDNRDFYILIRFTGRPVFEYLP